MNIYAITTLTIMLSTVATAQEYVPAATDKHQVLPFPDSQVTNLFNRGYQTFGGEVSIIRIALRSAPERQYFAKIGDYVGSYRIDRVAETGKDSLVYLVRSNETVVIRAQTPSENENRAEQGAPPYCAQGTAGDR